MVEKSIKIVNNEHYSLGGETNYGDFLLFLGRSLRKINEYNKYYSSVDEFKK